MKINNIDGSKIDAIKGSSILDSALKEGIIFEHSCKNGRCGSCKIELISGDVKEISEQISLTKNDLQNKKILSCCTEPLTDININAENLTALKHIKNINSPAKINEIKTLSDDILELKLRLPPTINFNFLEGQFVDIIKGNIRRSYSLLSNNDENILRFLIKNYDNGVMSDYLFNSAKEDDLLRIEGPKGTFFVRDIEKNLVFLATGTGIAPIYSILKSLNDNKAFKKKAYLFWGNRYQKDFVLDFNFPNLDLDVYKTSSRDSSEKIYVHELALKEIKDIKKTHIYACGSMKMIESAKEKMNKSGLNDDQFFYDAFVQTF